VKITEVTTWVVNVPLTTGFSSSISTKTGTTRTVVRLRTDDGAEGWGETMNGRPVAALIDKLSARVVGRSPFSLESLHQDLKMVPFFYGYLGYAALAGIDIACWDLIGKVTGQPLSNLIGGCVRDRVPVSGLVTRAAVKGVSAADMPAALAEHAESAIAAHGFGAVKLKGSSDVSGDLSIMEALRERLPDAQLRIDPNAAWSVPDSVQAGLRLEEMRLEYLEDPCTGLEGMSAVRQRVRIPLCTNMCVVRFEDVAPAVRLKAVDIIHGDVFKWGGIAATKNLASQCTTLGFGMNLHSGGELGLSTAAHLAVVASTPALRYAIDSMYYLISDDIITERFELTSGSLPIPTDSGLGVQVDEDKLRHYAKLNETDGDYTL
jgi:glucarate dehydratase